MNPLGESDVRNLLRLGLYRVAAHVLLAADEAGPSAWRLIGRSVARTRRMVEEALDRVPEGENREQLTLFYLQEPVLEGLVKVTYLFARLHGLGRRDDPRLPRQEALLVREMGIDPSLRGGEA